MYKEKIIQKLTKITGGDDIKLEVPTVSDFGNYSSNIAMILSKSKGKNPREYATEIVKSLKKEKDYKELFEKVEVAGPGFINFYLNKDVLISNLIQIDVDYGRSNIGKGKTVVIDYSAPNIAKPFGIGHLRSTIIGQALYNIYEFLGFRVIGDNHLGDWGTQFGKLLYMIDKKNPEKLNLDTLEKLYVEFHELEINDSSLSEAARKWFKKLESGDKKAKEVWQKCVDISMKEFEKIYKLLGISIDYTYGESFYQDIMDKIVQSDSISKHVVPGEDGKSRVIELSKFGIKTPLMLLKSDGATTYATRDLATIKFRVDKWNPDIIIYEVGAEHLLHFKQVFAAAKLLGLVNDNVIFYHTAHGLYLSPDGKKFSTRKGKTVKLEEVLREAIKIAKDLGSSDEKTAKQVGIGAIKYFDLKHSVTSDVIFDWNKILNLQGNSGPYLQYTLVRIKSIISNRNNFKGLSLNNSSLKEFNPNKEELEVLNSLLHFPEVVKDASIRYSPNLLCNYLFDLASKFNTFYSSHKIVGGDNENLKLSITKSVGQVVENGLKLLGIESPEKM